MKFKIAMDEDCEAKKAFANVLKSINLPIRECIILIQRLNLLYDNGESHFYNIPLIAGALLILKHTNNSVYKLFFSEKYATIGISKKTRECAWKKNAISLIGSFRGDRFAHCIRFTKSEERHCFTSFSAG